MDGRLSTLTMLELEDISSLQVKRCVESEKSEAEY